MNDGILAKVHPGKNNTEFLKQFPSDKETLKLSSGENIEIDKYFLKFKEWEGQPISNTYGNKTVLDWNGETVFAELAVLRLFESHGWSGVWVDSYRRKYRIGLPELSEPVQLPLDKLEVINNLRSKTGKFGGCWDIFIWNGDQTLFAELKRRRKDRIQNSQINWLEKSLELGFTKSNFLFIEWEVTEK